MTQFRKGIGDLFVDALKGLAASGGWWRDVLADTSLLIAVRDESLNVYWHGQSIFKITYSNRKVHASTHPKYLLDPDISKLVSFNGERFEIEELRRTGLIETYEATTLNKLKRSAERYAVGEKIGVHSIVHDNPSVVDVESHFRRTAKAAGPTWQRSSPTATRSSWYSGKRSSSRIPRSERAQEGRFQSSLKSRGTSRSLGMSREF